MGGCVLGLMGVSVVCVVWLVFVCLGVVVGMFTYLSSRL